MRNLLYILVDGVPVPEPDTIKWGQWFEQTDQRVIARDELPGGAIVSTVFLAIDHNFHGRGRPVLYETMIFGGPVDQEQMRYCNRDEAIAGHAILLENARRAGIAGIKEAP